ncbi:hypothetical protein ED733_001693 [Metarhizium rileyi]|uniref:Uncharacterized protein n=1 Tax=Metarhizium rileyi (strain RCEF 4871) TaxID=1649241 RepID=A0A5C6G5H1_METRR|nr:hypothetical protein ED733_001693 [Metarhizium rileyi]
MARVNSQDGTRRATDSELKWLSYFDWAASLYYPMLKKLFDAFFDGDFPHRGKDVFRRHYKEVRSLVHKDRLLEYTITDDWGPLCEFLGEPVPKDVSFPRINDNSDFVSRSRRRNRNQMKNVALRVLVWFVAILFAIWLLCCLLNLPTVAYTLVVPLGYKVTLDLMSF